MPIDTGQLQDSIYAILDDESAVITIRDIVLQYDDHSVRAKLLALYLEVPSVNRSPRGGGSKREIHFKRSQSNVLPNAQKGMQTSFWFENGIKEGLKELDSLAATLTKAAVQQFFKELLSGT